MTSKNNIRRTPGNKDFGKPGQSDGFFRKAGDKLQGFGEAVGRGFLDADAKYASKLRGDGNSQRTAGQISELMGKTSVRDIMARSVDADSQVEKVLGAVMDAGVIGTNLGYRYGLPAAGVTLAGKGLFDIGVALGEAAADRPTERELGM